MGGTAAPVGGVEQRQPRAGHRRVGPALRGAAERQEQGDEVQVDLQRHVDVVSHPGPETRPGVLGLSAGPSGRATGLGFRPDQVHDACLRARPTTTTQNHLPVSIYSLKIFCQRCFCLIHNGLKNWHCEQLKLTFRERNKN